MPVINVRSKDSAGKLELNKFAEEISNITGVAVSRLQIIAEYYPPEDFFTDDVHAIIQIAISEKNDKNVVQGIMKACVTAASKQFKVEENHIAVTASTVGSGYLLVNNNFI